MKKIVFILLPDFVQEIRWRFIVFFMSFFYLVYISHENYQKFLYFVVFSHIVVYVYHIFAQLTQILAKW